jgi:tRNA threonylcarbamoyl adenosine modification protein YeaZ
LGVSRLAVGLETGTDVLSVGVWDVPGRLVRARVQVRAPRSHARLLLPLLWRTLEDAGGRLEDVERLCVAVGPGSYTGIRVGVATALGFMVAKGISVVGVPTLQAAAMDAPRGTSRILAVTDAGRGGVYAQAFAWPEGEGFPLPLDEPQRYEQAEVPHVLGRLGAGRGDSEGEMVVLCGPAAPLVAEEAKGRARLAGSAGQPVDPVHVAQLGLCLPGPGEPVAAGEEGSRGQAVAVAPIYLRPAAKPPSAGGGAAG